MPKADGTDRWRPSAAFGLCASGVALGFLLGGFPAAFGAFVVCVGILSVRRSRTPRHSIPRAACDFVVQASDEQRIAMMLFRLRDDGEDVREHLRAHGWSMLEPPLDGPQVPVRGIGVEFLGDRSLVVHDVRGVVAREVLIADRLTEVPAGWGRAAEESGYVLLLLDDVAKLPATAPRIGAYAVLRGAVRAA